MEDTPGNPKFGREVNKFIPRIVSPLFWRI